MSPDPDPTRRHLLRVGGLSLTLGALVAACSGEDDPTPAAEPRQTTTTEPEPAASGTALLNTALSLAVLTFETYQVALDSGLVERREVADAFRLFQQHHGEHRGTLVATVESEGQEPFDTGNPVAKVAVVNPALASVAAERDLVRLLRDLEHLGAQLAVHAASALETPELRATIMGIGAVASRRAAYLDRLGDLGSEQLSVYPTSNPLPADAIVPD